MKKGLSLMAVISRFAVGLVFSFSGFVKAVDPLGTAYKIEEYINVFGFFDLLQYLPWLPVVLSMVLCSLELLIGLMLIVNLQHKTVAWTVSVMMLFFTVLTLVDAITNKVTDCGCFGEAIKLTNWQTFFKNIILDFFVVFIFLTRNHSKKHFSKIKSISLTALLFCVILIFSGLNYRYEPMIDFRPWKEGSRMVPAEQAPPLSYALYRHNETNEQKEFSMQDLMTAYQEDPNFASNWTWVDTRVLNETTIAADGFSMTPIDENKDVSLDFLYQEGYIFFVTAYDLSNLNEKAMRKIFIFAKQAQKQNHAVALLTASPAEECVKLLQRYPSSTIPMYYSDNKAIKTMMRSNPGLLLMRNGVVLKKWSAHCIPDFEEVDFDALFQKYQDR